MRTRGKHPYFIEVRVNKGKRYYAYVANITMSAGEARNCVAYDLFGAPDERINISKKAWRLASIRCQPDKDEEVSEIVDYSNGKPIKLSFFEKVVLFFTRE